jgi:hypothetical protein
MKTPKPEKLPLPVTATVCLAPEQVEVLRCIHHVHFAPDERAADLSSVAELVLKLALTRMDMVSGLLSTFVAYRDAEELEDGSGTLSSSPTIMVCSVESSRSRSPVNPKASAAPK